MKKGIKIALIVLAVLLLAAAGLCWWQRDNIAALKMSLSNSRSDLSQMIEENNQRVEDVSNRLPVTVRDLTDEEKTALQDGSVDRDELIARLIGKETPSAEPSPGESGAPEGSQTVPPEEPSQPAEETDEEKLSRYIAEIYLMKSEYTAWLEAEYAGSIEEYLALPETERTTAAKYEIGMRHMRAALDKEKECDQRMADIEGKILALLREMGEDASLVDEIQAAYEEEKALKKAYYLGLHD